MSIEYLPVIFIHISSQFHTAGYGGGIVAIDATNHNVGDMTKPIGGARGEGDWHDTRVGNAGNTGILQINGVEISAVITSVA
jgi:hypothetical protein